MKAENFLDDWLCGAAAAGDEETVMRWLDQGGDVNARDEKTGISWPLLHYAVCSDNIGFVSRLIERGAKVNGNSYCGSALHLAVQRKNESMIRLLVDSGADINIRAPLHQETVLTYALDELHYSPALFPIVKLLIELGVDVNARDDGGYTALWGAIDDNKLEILQYLESHGADLHVCDDEGSTLLHYAAEYEEEKVFHYLLQKGLDRNVRNFKGKTPDEVWGAGREG